MSAAEGYSLAEASNVLRTHGVRYTICNQKLNYSHGTSNCIKHVRRHVPIPPKNKKQEQVHQLLTGIDMAKKLTDRQLDLLATKRTFNSANFPTKTGLARTLTGKQDAFINTPLVKHTIVKIYVSQTKLLKEIEDTHFSVNLDEMHQKYTRLKYLGIRLNFVSNHFSVDRHYLDLFECTQIMLKWMSQLYIWRILFRNLAVN